MNKKTNRLIKISLFSAMAFILMYMEFPLFPLFPWLKMDFGDVPALIGGFALGPLAGVTIELIKNLLKLLMKGTNSGLVGETANFLVGISLILPASLLYRKNKSRKSIILGMILGAVLMEISAIITNIYFLLPAYGMHMSPAESARYVAIGLIPFNGLKALFVSVLTYILYKKVAVAIFNDNSDSNNKENKAI